MEKEIDRVPFTLPIMGEPRHYSTWNVLVAHELLVYEMLSQPAEGPYDQTTIFDHAKNGLKHALNWIALSCSERGTFKPPKSLHKKRCEEAQALLDLGIDYQSVETAFTEWSRGTASAELVGPREVRFVYDIEEASLPSQKSRDILRGVRNPEAVPQVVARR